MAPYVLLIAVVEVMIIPHSTFLRDDLCTFWL